MDRQPWTHEELEKLVPRIEKELDDTEAQYEGKVKPLPKLSQQECLDYFFRLMNIAAERPLTQEECFIHGQLLNVYRQTVMAEMLGKGKESRYMVISEDDMAQLLRMSDMEGSFFDAFRKEMRAK